MKCLLIIFALLFVSHGCATVDKQSSESREESLTAVGSVTGALAGRELSDKEMERLGQQIQKDEKAMSAVESIGKALDVHDTKVKYCPKTGKRYSANLTVCPEHGEKLEKVE